MVDAPQASAFKFDAFISYSHQADDVLAPALHRALHEFARPRFKKRALHVFRDQTSLSANPELWTAIEAALSQSHFLLLMASPASAASRWVRREVAWWLEHRSPQTMLILVTDGELVWDEDGSDFDWVRTTCVPREALGGRLAREPLWVDLRWARNGETLTLRHGRFRQAVLDIAAPLHGRDKDELDGEDVRLFLRSQRVRRAVKVGLVVLTDLAFSPTGEQVAVRMDVAGKVQIGSTAQREWLYELDRVPPGQLAALAEGAWALAVVGKSQAWLWDVRTDRARARLPQPAMAAAIDGRDLVALVEIDLGNATKRQRLVRLPWTGAAFAATALPAGLDAQTIESIEVAHDTVRLTIRNESAPYGLVWTAGDDRWTRADASRAVADAATAASTAGRSSTTHPAVATGPHGVRSTDESVIVTRNGIDMAQIDIPTSPPAGRCLARRARGGHRRHGRRRVAAPPRGRRPDRAGLRAKASSADAGAAATGAGEGGRGRLRAARRVVRRTDEHAPSDTLKPSRPRRSGATAWAFADRQ